MQAYLGTEYITTTFYGYTFGRISRITFSTVLSFSFTASTVLSDFVNFGFPASLAQPCLGCSFLLILNI